MIQIYIYMNPIYIWTPLYESHLYMNPIYDNVMPWVLGPSWWKSWANCWTNSRVSGDLRRTCDATVMTARTRTYPRNVFHSQKPWNSHKRCFFFTSSCLYSTTTFNMSSQSVYDVACWRHRMEAFFVLLALCEENPLYSGGFPSQRPVTRSYKVFFDLRLNKWLSKQSRRRWFETPSRSLWRHCDGKLYCVLSWNYTDGSCIYNTFHINFTKF